MLLTPTILPGVHVVDLEARSDERGLFGRTWCADEARMLGLCPQFAQCSVSFSAVKGTLRGMHFQTEPYEEIKLVRCTAGAIFDVVIDLRTESSTFRRWIAEELTAENRRALYVPKGCAHGFQTLAEATEVYYQITPGHHPEFSSGVRWDDPAFGIRWPEVPRALSERDRLWPDFTQ